MNFLERIKGEFGPSAQDDEELLRLIAQAAEKKATTLNLSGKKLKRVPKEIGQLVNLKSLNLRNNKIEKLPPEIEQLSKLTKLYLYQNQLKTLPPQIGQLNHLVELELWGNELKALPPQIGQLSHLVKLELWSNQLEALPPEIGQLSHLTRLSISFNKLHTLPSEIGQLSNLIELEVYYNELKTLPPEIGRLRELRIMKISNNQLSTLPTQIWQLSKLTTLDLSSNKLSRLSPEIGQLTNLQKLYLANNPFKILPKRMLQLTHLSTLDLSCNQLSTLPAQIAQLRNLTELNLNNNKLSTLPAQIAQLRNLTELNLNNNKLSTLPTPISQLSKLAILDLSSNQLSTLLPKIGQLTNLQKLNLANNPLRTLPQEMLQLTRLITLDLSRNQLLTLPAQIAQLRNLTELNLNDNQLSTLPVQIWQLSKLIKLDLSSNQLSTLSPKIGLLTNLQKLNLASNQLKALPQEIWQLTRLSTLNLGRNQLSTLPTPVFKLSKLIKLYLQSNRLTQLPDVFLQLGNLGELDLGNNQLLTLPPEISQLSKLTKLCLENNQLKTLPPEISQLSKLTKLCLENNQLKTLPPEIGQLRNLTELQLNRNRLSWLPAQISQLKQLTIVDLHSNRLKTLPSEIWQLLNRMSKLDLRDNPLPIPPEILSYTNKPDMIIKYYLRAGKKLNEAKLVLVGQGGVGKTSLVKRLIEQRFDKQEPITKGVNIKQWGITIDSVGEGANGNEHIRLNVWDFGGQEIMHATHQFFLTTRTLYLLVLDARQGAIGSRLDYWLQLIQSFGANSPIIVVINKIDEYPRILNQRELRAKYPTIKAFVNTSCKSGKGIAELERQICVAIDKLDHVRDLIPVEWLNIRTQLERMGQNYIAYGKYVQVCEAQQISKEQEQRLLIRLLHDLGVVLNFEDDPQLRKTIILSPKWITGAVYQIINARALHNKGVLEIGQLSDILQSYVYPQETYLLILDMMRRFERCFDLEGYVGQKFLLPDLLPIEEPPLDVYVWPTDHLDFEYRYNFLPASVISRFMVQMHGFILGNHAWRTGVALVKDKNKALIKAFPQEKRIEISIIGEAKGRRQFLTYIRSRFEQIHHDIVNLQATEYVGYEGEMISCALLHKLHKRDLPHHTIPLQNGDIVMVNVQELLDRVKRESSQQEDRKIQRLLEQLKQELHPQQFYAGALLLGKDHYKVGAYSLARQALAVTHQAMQAWRAIERKDKAYVKERAELYDMLVHCCVEENNHLKAFEYTAVAKGCAFINKLAEAKFDLKRFDDQEEFADKLKQAHQLRNEIEKSRNAMPVKALSDKRSQLHKLLLEENELWEEMTRDYPLLTATFTAPTLSSQQASNLANTLQSTLVEVFRHGGGWGAFVVTAHDISYIPLPALNNDLLTRFVQLLNQAHLPAGRLPTGDKRWAKLYEAVIAPSKLKDQRVIMALFEPLHLLPLSAAYQQFTNCDSNQKQLLSFVPSLTMLHVFKQELERRPFLKESIRNFLSVACPGSSENLLSIFM